ncbi:MAG: sulfatase-like hydrolase/transferase [Odoribacter sp.]|nr:sulfatase-like hydrolase/transferase [Odoribacter sp.]
MYVAFNASHDPRQSPEEVILEYEGKNIKVPANFLPDHPFDINIHGERDENLAPYPRTEEAIQVHRKEYYAIITHMDREIGRILDAIEEQGYGDNTYIIFTSDQGLAVGMHGLMGKQNLYEHSIRVPLIITGPGIKKGKQIKEMVYMQSVYPTTCELAGIEIPSSVDFKSLVPCLEGEKGEEYIFGYFRHIHRMIRSDRYKLIVYPESKNIQLFDLKKDPYEVVNLADNPKYKKIKEELFVVLQQKQEEIGDTVKLHSEDYF